jgi:hypothetical protein
MRTGLIRAGLIRAGLVRAGLVRAAVSPEPPADLGAARPAARAMLSADAGHTPSPPSEPPIPDGPVAGHRPTETAIRRRPVAFSDGAPLPDADRPSLFARRTDRTTGDHPNSGPETRTIPPTRCAATHRPRTPSRVPSYYTEFGPRMQPAIRFGAENLPGDPEPTGIRPVGYRAITPTVRGPRWGRGWGRGQPRGSDHPFRAIHQSPSIIRAKTRAAALKGRSSTASSVGSSCRPASSSSIARSRA